MCILYSNGIILLYILSEIRKFVIYCNSKLMNNIYIKTYTATSLMWICNNSIVRRWSQWLLKDFMIGKYILIDCEKMVWNIWWERKR